MTSSSVKMQQAIVSTAEGFFHQRVVLILGLANAADAVEILSIGYILAVYEDKEGPLSRTQQSLVAAAVFVGMLIGGLVFGSLSDRLGRRKSLLISLLLNGVFGLVSCVSPHIDFLICCRTIAGIGIGGAIPAMFTLCSEHVPAHRRGYYVTIVASFWMVGSVFTAGLAWIMLGNPSTAVSWRVFAAVVSLPAFLCFGLTLQFVPESAQYLAHNCLFHEARQVVNHIRTTNATEEEAQRLLSPFPSNFTTATSTEPSSSQYAGGDLEQPLLDDDDLVTERTTWESYSVLFEPVLRATTMSLLVSWFCLSFGSYGLATWITVLFKRINLSNPFANAFLYAAANLPGNLFSGLLMDRYGGRCILLVSMVFATICATLFALANNAGAAVAIVVLACGFNAFSTSGWNAIDLMSAESFPTEIRTTGMGLLSASGRCGSMVAQLVNGFLIGPPAHVTLLISITAGMMCLGSSSSYFVRDHKGKVLVTSIEELRSLARAHP